MYNEDGLFGERVGWHLPGFDDSLWEDATTSSSSSELSCDDGEDEEEGEGTVLTATGGTVTFFRTVIPIHLSLQNQNQHPNQDQPQESLDTTLTLPLTTPTTSSKAYRLQLFINGYQYGRFNPFIGNQVAFPIPPGIVNFDGENTVAIAVWAQTSPDEEVRVRVEWGVEYLVLSPGSSDVGRVSREAGEEGLNLRPGWTSERERFG